ncbi:hypothetical protein [Thalassomonas actiniarum]|uniref:Uncharacterized protein n=1 Tax=Thalassomonas actiniarum TaxID=485447 RepID=A0AAF0C3T7_9GAMM|nr:hypothetical protein [Thalassomonas actiniarum]WDD99295.1 hypothetical protein SG35_000985 [Thalassomonas actiniarum]
MYRVLFLSIIALSFSVVAEQQDIVKVVKACQNSINSGNSKAALKHFLPSKREEMAGTGGEVLVSLFTDLKLDSSSIKQSCNQTECKVYVDALKAGQNQKVVYTLVKHENAFYISNIQAKST